MLTSSTGVLLFMSLCLLSTYVPVKGKIKEGKANKISKKQENHVGLSKEGMELSYEEGERTEGLRMAVLKAKRLKPCDKTVVQQNQTWCISVDGMVKAIDMQGFSTEKIQGEYTFIRTKDGTWHKLHHVSNNMKVYLSGLPWQYDDTKQVAFDGTNILIRRKKELYSKVTNLIELKKKVVYVQDNDGRKLQFPITKDTTRFITILQNLPKFVDDLPVMKKHPPLVDPVQTVIEAEESKGKKHPHALSDLILCELEGSWHIRDGNDTHEIVLNGLTLEKTQQPFIFARALDGSWHMFLKVPDGFRSHIATLPWVQVGMGRLFYDGRSCFVKKPFGTVVKIYMRGKIFGQEFKAHGEDERIYNCYAFGKCLQIIKNHIFERPSEDKIRTRKGK